MSNLNLQKLSELCTLYSGGTPSTSNESYWNGNLNWMSSGETSNKLIYGTKLKISEKGVAESSTRLAHSGDTVVATAGEGKTRGQTSYLLTDTYVNQSIVVLEADKTKIDNKFLFYAVSNSYNRMRALSDAAGIRGSLPCKLLNNFEINTFNLDIENKIGQFLFNIDLKIENNNKINAELESLAKTIYDYWFLQFEFPNEEGKPYKSSGGKMVWNEELKREIPEGWKTATLDKVISVSNERISSKEIGDRLYVPIECIPRKQMSFYETADIEKAATGLCPFDENSILISNRRVYFHKVSITPFKGVTRDTVIIVNPLDKNNLGYVFQLLFSDHFISFATLNSYGTEQPVFSPTSFSQYRITIPNNSLDIEYSKKVKPIINRILENQRENKKLSSLRDFLLPMLMNGQVQFK